jgi:hypothetical protein
LPDGSIQDKVEYVYHFYYTTSALCGDAAGWTALGATGITCFADMSEFGKGSLGMQESLNTNTNNTRLVVLLLKRW